MSRPARTPRAAIVVDLGFGAAGKGLLTDFSVRELGADLVVRFHGGAQAGHNVVTEDGRHHTFSQFGAGTFVPSARTLLARDVVVHPLALLVEARVLAAKGVPDALARLEVHRDALVITPFHQAAGRLRELARGDARHGSCGIGFGEAVHDARTGHEALTVGDLEDPPRARAALERIRARKRAELEEVLAACAGRASAEADARCFDDPGLVGRFLDAAAPFVAGVGRVDDDGVAHRLRSATSIVFEGAQGVLLDEDFGFHPHTTYSRSTYEGAAELLARHAPSLAVERIGVLRSYATRHGEGPFPTHDPALDAHLPEPHNASDGAQGAFRRGALDLVLARYALAVAGPVDTLAITHLDAIARLGRWDVAVGTRPAPGDEDLFVVERGLATAIRLPDRARPRPLDHQERLGAALSRATPVLERLPEGEARALARLEDHLGVGVGLVARGPRARDVSRR